MDKRLQAEARRASDARPEDHPLYPPLMAAIHQAVYGKGERHGGGTTPFLEQPIFHYAKMHGRGFLTGQAAKKLEEAASTRAHDAFVNECLGAIVYLAAAVIYEQQQADKQGKDRIYLRGFGEPAAGQMYGASPELKDAALAWVKADARAKASAMMAQQSTTERSWQDYHASRNRVQGTLGTMPQARNCTTCLHEPREHTEWPCNVCSENPQVLPQWASKA